MSSERLHISRRPLIGSDPRRPVGFYLEIVIDRGRNGMCSKSIFMALITDALYNIGKKLLHIAIRKLLLVNRWSNLRQPLHFDPKTCLPVETIWRFDLTRPYSLILSLSGLWLSKTVGAVVICPCSTVSGTDLSVSHRMSISGATGFFLSNNASWGLSLSLSRPVDCTTLSDRIIGGVYRCLTVSGLGSLCWVLALSRKIRVVHRVSLSRPYAVLSGSGVNTWLVTLSLSVTRTACFQWSLSVASQRTGIRAADICINRISHGSLSRDNIVDRLLTLSKTVAIIMVSLSGLRVRFPGIYLSLSGNVSYWHLLSLSSWWPTLSETGSAFGRSLSLDVGTNFLSGSGSSRPLSLTVLQGIVCL